MHICSNVYANISQYFEVELISWILQKRVSLVSVLTKTPRTRLQSHFPASYVCVCVCLFTCT